MICPNCGAQLPDTATMCYSCRMVMNNNPNMNSQQQQFNTQNLNNPSSRPDPRNNMPSQITGMSKPKPYRGTNVVRNGNPNPQKKNENTGCLSFIIIIILAMAIIPNLTKHKDSSSNADSNQDSNTVETVTESTAEDVRNVESVANDQSDTGITSIEDFSYSIDNGVLKLKEYKGSDKTVHIGASYLIDGQDYKTDLSEFMAGIGNHIDTIVFDEGITSVQENVFNSCDVQNIYFPSTMTEITAYTLSYLHPDEGTKIQIYYSSTEDNWKEIYKNGPDGYSDSYQSGAEFANELNELMGDETSDEDMYKDENNYTFHFQSDEGEVVMDGSELAYTQESAEDYTDAETPSYEDLMRYPDTYKSKKIVINVVITEVEPDGIIFDGDIVGEYEGQEIAFDDNRLTKEPKLLEGDAVTIYGYGKGTATMKIKQGLKTIDEYNIPMIDIRYLEIN